MPAARVRAHKSIFGARMRIFALNIEALRDQTCVLLRGAHRHMKGKLCGLRVLCFSCAALAVCCAPPKKKKAPMPRGRRRGRRQKRPIVLPRGEANKTETEKIPKTERQCPTKAVGQIFSTKNLSRKFSVIFPFFSRFQTLQRRKRCGILKRKKGIFGERGIT